jgi:putative DNA primase/helicase
MSEKFPDDNDRLMAGELLDPFEGTVEWVEEEELPPEPDMPPGPPDEVYGGSGDGAGDSGGGLVLDPECLDLPYTDLGNARRFVRYHIESVRWCQARDRWLVWDGTHWTWEEKQQVQTLAQATVDALLLESKEFRRRAAQFDWDDERASKLRKRAEVAWKHYMASQGNGRVGAITKQACSLPDVPVSTDDFDKDSWLLGVENGTIELKTQTFREHRRKDLITRLAPVAYDAAAKAPAWERFVREVFPDDSVRVFVQRAVGYSLTGDIGQQVWFVLQGEGSNGKSTLLEVLSALLGSYATTLPQGFLEARENDAHPTESTGLHRARFAAGTEPRAKRSWDSEKIKRQTGGDIIEARFMHGDFFFFRPTHKLWVSVNDMPRSDDMGTGWWRRMVIIPFTQRWYRDDEEGLPKVDPTLPERLRAELPGILNWAIEGLRAFQTLKGLAIPKVCRAAVAEYRDEQDELARFLVSRCSVSTSALDTVGTYTAVLYAVYRKWREGEGLDGKPVSNVKFGRELRKRYKGITPKERAGRTYWPGLTLVDLPDEGGEEEDPHR